MSGNTSPPMSLSSKYNRRSVDVFEALHHIRAQEEAGIGVSDSNLPLMAPSEWPRPVSIPASSLGTFQVPGVPGEWRASGTVTPASRASYQYSQQYSSSMSTLPGVKFSDKPESIPPQTPISHAPESIADSVPPLPHLPAAYSSEIFFSQIHEYAFIINVCLAQLFSLAALAQTVAPLPIIANYFNNHDPGQLSWFTAAYSLTVGTFILPAGKTIKTAFCHVSLTYLSREAGRHVRS